MAHHTLKNGYSHLAEHINLMPQGAPVEDLLYKILAVLFSEKEADRIALLPLRPFTAAAAAKNWKTTEDEARKALEALADRGMILDTENPEGKQIFCMPPPMAGFFEFSMMRVGGSYDQKLLANLYYQYLNVEEDFIKNLFAGGETQLGRVFVSEPSLSEENCLHVLDYERASEVIRTASHRGIGTCYCRHKMRHLGKACEAPLEICMTFGGAAESLIKHGVARGVDVREAIDLLDTAVAHNLVQFGENVRQSVSFICNCCGCCCEAMLAAKRFAVLNPISTTNFLPTVAAGACTGCGKCAEVCPVEAMSLVSAGDPHDSRRKKARLNAEICLGCGVCARACPTKSIALVSREKRVITPVNGAHRTVIMAIERGKLQNLIFDNQALASHRAMAAILGVILKLPPAKQILASRQMKSRYLDYLFSHTKF
ncbi:MAG: 4Fe-4S dicluster domain-containing protein [Candidatus Hydrogenedentales bacterium]